MHNADVDADHVADLIDSSQTFDEAARRYELVQTMRAFQDTRFRPVVLNAYSYRCAMCGTVLKLVDATHIVPVHQRTSLSVSARNVAIGSTFGGA